MSIYLLNQHSDEFIYFTLKERIRLFKHTKKMGSQIEFNDTLKLSEQQGFPSALHYAQHLKQPFTASMFDNQLFQFTKNDIRFYHAPPTRVFLVQSTGDKWLYWGHVLVQTTTHHLTTNETSGSFIITKLFSVEEMKMAFRILDGRAGKDFFGFNS